MTSATNTVAAYIYLSNAASPHNNKIVTIVKRAESDGDLEPMFEVELVNGATFVASGFELHPWYPVR